MRALDGWLAVNLARPWDREVCSAWVEHDEVSWERLVEAVGERPSDELVQRAEWLGLPVARVDGEHGPCPAFGDTSIGDLSGLVVVDLSSLWAGPLCGRLLAERGARVIKVESAARPDGARVGDPGFWAGMNSAKELVVVDLGHADGRHRFDELLDAADVVIEASRPRALASLGWSPARAFDGDTMVWISITGYGRTSERVAFGDDAAAGAGIVTWDGDVPSFFGDAIADPLTGMTAAAAALSSIESGAEPALVEVSLVGAARAALHP
jgi:crotonobetainyl-CoA:carnitine CoA-transferase CaiB-like acyl-CoA transferase